MSSDITIPSYEIFPHGDHCRRVHWTGPLENVRPAEDAERLSLELNENDVLRSAPHHIELDLFHCTTINTRGIAFLVYLGRRLDLLGATWSIVNAPVILNRMFQTLCLTDSFVVETAQLDSPAASAGDVLQVPSADASNSLDLCPTTHDEASE